MRSELKTVIGVDAGTLTVAETLLPYDAVELPLLCSELGVPLVSTAQSGPPSVAVIAEPPALTRYSTSLLELGEAM